MVAQFWQRDVRTEYSLNNRPSIEEQERMARELGARFVVKMRDTTHYSSGVVEVYDLDTRESRQVHKNEVADFVQASVLKAKQYAASVLRFVYNTS